ncbi:MAG TPA: inositol monophosphatase family protein [Bacteroidia bacterium]|jgi:myo-inositol-1(or 4)-monophosphatase|nr:inositol monophosphatase family protein [Bacteroidia bacterium]
MSEQALNLNSICKEVIELTHEVGDFILKERNKFNSSHIIKKGFNDLVSYVDRMSEERLIMGLLKILPHSGILGEESGGNFNSKYTWVIDPLDGTTNFVHGLPCFAISIALFENMQPVIGVVNELNFKECFSAIKGKGANVNGKKITVSPQDDLQDSLIATGFPYNDFEQQKEYMKLFEELMKCTQGLRRIGSASVDLCYVALGRFEVFYEYGLKPWDVSGGALIVQEAGGKLSDFDGGDDYIFGKTIVASNGHLHKPFMEIVNRHFKGKMKKI